MVCFLPLPLGTMVGKVGRAGGISGAAGVCCGRAGRGKAKTDPLAKLDFLITGVLGGTTMKRSCHGNYCKRLSISRKPDCERMGGSNRIKLM